MSAIDLGKQGQSNDTCRSDRLVPPALKNVGGRKRRIYKITPVGKKALDKAKAKVDELHHELHEEHPRKISPFGDNSAST
jgi:PadR family transcriptional regulator